MEQIRSDDRRVGLDRRNIGAVTYTGPERRKLEYRRSGLDRRAEWPAVCVYCGKVCDDLREWSLGASTIETKVECRTGICIDCSKKKFPQFYNGSQSDHS